MRIEALPLLSHLHKAYKFRDIFPAALSDSNTRLMGLSDPCLGSPAVAAFDLFDIRIKRYPECEPRLLVFKTVVERLVSVSQMLTLYDELRVILALDSIAVDIDSMQSDIRVYPEIQSTALPAKLFNAVCHELQKLAV